MKTILLIAFALLGFAAYAAAQGGDQGDRQSGGNRVCRGGDVFILELIYLFLSATTTGAEEEIATTGSA